MFLFHQHSQDVSRDLQTFALSNTVWQRGLFCQQQVWNEQGLKIIMFLFDVAVSTQALRGIQDLNWNNSTRVKLSDHLLSMRIALSINIDLLPVPVALPTPISSLSLLLSSTQLLVHSLHGCQIHYFLYLSYYIMQI